MFNEEEHNDEQLRYYLGEIHAGEIIIDMLSNRFLSDFIDLVHSLGILWITCAEEEKWQDESCKKNNVEAG